MLFSFRTTYFTLLFLSTLFVFSQTVFAGDDWREVSQAEIQMKTPKVEADADAEAHFLGSSR